MYPEVKSEGFQIENPTPKKVASIIKENLGLNPFDNLWEELRAKEKEGVKLQGINFGKFEDTERSISIKSRKTPHTIIFTETREECYAEIRPPLGLEDFTVNSYPPEKQLSISSTDHEKATWARNHLLIEDIMKEHDLSF